MDHYLLVPNHIKYPLTDLIIGLGFFFVLLLEKIVMRINKRKVQVLHDWRLFLMLPNNIGERNVQYEVNVVINGMHLCSQKDV
jgi:hypothetical protein